MSTISTTVFQWINSTSKIPVFVVNRNSGNLATNTRGIAVDALRDNNCVKSNHFFKSADWLFKLDIEFNRQYCLKEILTTSTKELNTLQFSLQKQKLTSQEKYFGKIHCFGYRIIETSNPLDSKIDPLDSKLQLIRLIHLIHLIQTNQFDLKIAS